MKKFFKIIGILLLIVIAVISGLLIYVKTALPNVGEAPDLKIDKTPERIKHGEYLANHVMICMDCHSERDWSKFAGPLKPGTLGKGGEKFDRNFNFPGEFYAKNITPAGIKDWTDGELFRVITTGVSKDGSAIFPVMPYVAYGKADPEDIYDIIAYIRSIELIENVIPERSIDFPMNFIINTIPQKASPGKRPNSSDKLAYGEYLVNAAACSECHTKAIKGKKVEGMDYAGGFEFKTSRSTIIRSANITPDIETGIGSWTKEMFVERFKFYADSSYVPQEVKEGDFNSIMPWVMYAGMEVSDLEAIYEYLRTIKPITNKVNKFEEIPVAER